MFAGQSFMPMMGQLKLAQVPTPGQAPAPAPAPAAPAVAFAPPVPAPVIAPAPAPVVTTGLSHGAQVVIAAGLAALALIGAAFLSE